MLSERLQQLKIHIKQFSAQVRRVLQEFRWYIILAYENALSIFTKKAFPQEYAKRQYNLGIAYLMSSKGKYGANLHRTITAFENALQFYTEEAFPQKYALTQLLLGFAYQELQAGDREANLRCVITARENALRIYTKEAFPEMYAFTQRNLGLDYSQLLTEDREANLHRVITAFENALSVFENLNDWLDYYKTLEILSQEVIDKIGEISQKDQFGTYFYLLNAVHSFLDEQYYEAIQHLEKSLQQAKDSAYKIVTIYIYLAKANQAIFEIQKAKWYWKDALNVAKHINNKYLLDFVSVNLARVEIQFGQIERARERLHGISKDNGFADSVNQLLAACDTIEQQKQAFAL